MNQADPIPGGPRQQTPDRPARATDAPDFLDTAPVSTSWPTVPTPWGTPGNHLTGPIPRIRPRRRTHEPTESPAAEES